MKETILQREMFAAPVSKKTMNSGIMAGFEEDEDMMEEEMAEETPPMTRSPQNPEILMNNLRGDIRSIDARYLELAQMVGEEAAMETPPEVLAMLQGQMGAQAAPPPPPAGGIGALPQTPQMPPQGMMPPGMEGAAPFPQGGAEQAPPTPDGMPPLRAAFGMDVSQENRFDQAQQSLQFDMDRMLELASGNVPPEQMTERDMQLLQQYNMSMGFGGGIRDVAQQGGARIASALSPYVTRGRQMLSGLGEEVGGTINRIYSQLPPSLQPQGFRVAPMRGPLRNTDGGRIVVQGRENIVAGPGGMPTAGAGTKFERANTLDIGNMPFTQAFRESMRVNPRGTAVATGVGAGTFGAKLASETESSRDALSRFLGTSDISNITPDQLAAATDRINQIPNEYQERSQQFPLTPPTPPGQEPPSLSTINVAMNEPMVDLSTPFDAMGRSNVKKLDKPPVPLVNLGDTTAGKTQPSREEITGAIKDLLKDEKKTEAPTYGERLKKRFGEVESTYREIIGDTKSDMRANAFFLLADAGFKLASTYAPTLAVGIAQAASGLPRGFAALAAQAKDRGIKIRSAALSEAAQSIQLEDKYAKDIQRAILEAQSRAAVAILNATSREQIEKIKQEYGLRKEVLKGDIDYQIEVLRQGGGKPVEKDIGVGMSRYETKSGNFIKYGIREDAFSTNGVLGQMLNSPYTNNSTTNPFVVREGQSPFTASEDEATRKKLQNQVGEADSSLQALNRVRGQYVDAFSPGTFVVDKINNIIVPVAFGALKPDLKQDQVVANLRLNAQQLEKAMAATNDDGRLSNQEQEWVKELLNDINNPTGFFQNSERAAKQFAVLETYIRNKRQEKLMKLIPGMPNEVMKVPSTGTQNDPFIVSNDPTERQKLYRYLADVIGKSQAPNAAVYLQTPNGSVAPVSVEKIRQLVKQ